MRGATAAPTLYLGAAAGWDVDGLIGDASVLAHLSFAESTESLLAEHLARPAARRALMHPAKDGVALCPVVDDRGSLQGVVWGVYDLLDEGDRMRDAQVLVRRLEDARAQARFPQLPRNKAATEGCDQAVRRLASGAVNPQQAMIEALDAGSRETVTIVRNRQVFSVEAQWGLGISAASLALPDALVYGSPRAVGVSVAHLRFPNSNWAARAALFVGLRPEE